jgi:aspartate/methionine/tyrosine aminotransferase
MIKLRNQLLDIILESSYDLDVWIPQAGYFIITDASRLPILEKYQTSDDHQGILPKDYSLAYQFAHEKNVILIPCSDFYDKTNKNENYIRFAFCKDASIIESSRAKLK